MFDMRSVLDVDAVSAIRPGTNVLVTGPSMLGTGDLVLDFLADGIRDGEGAVYVTTGDAAGDAIAGIEARSGPVGDDLCVIDCRSDATPDADEFDAYVDHASDPSDLTGMGVAITACFERLEADGHETGRFGLDSLSTLLTYTDRETVFKFCHVLTSRLTAAEFVGVFVVDSSAHDEQTLQIVKQAFDGVIEVRESAAGREARAVGLTPEPSPWIELSE